MTNFIFKSPSDLQKIRQSQIVILDNLKWLRSDMQALDYKITKVLNQCTLQKQVDDFYEKHPDRELDGA